MKLESLKSPKFEPLNRENTLAITGGGYESSSGPGSATVSGRNFDYVSDCLRQLDDGSWRCTYTLADGTGVIYQS